jgi:hypothetical protein
MSTITQMQVTVALSKIEAVWGQLFPIEQQRIVQLLVERVIISPHEMQVRLYPNGLQHLALEALHTKEAQPA